MNPQYIASLTRQLTEIQNGKLTGILRCDISFASGRARNASIQWTTATVLRRVGDTSEPNVLSWMDQNSTHAARAATARRYTVSSEISYFCGLVVDKRFSIRQHFDDS